MTIEWASLKFPPINLWNIWPRMEPKDEWQTENYKGFTNHKCEAFPCHDTSKYIHPEEFNCLFCYCPLVWLECPGKYTVIVDADGNKRKDCSECRLPHDGYAKSWDIMNLSKWQKNPKHWSGK